MTRRPHPIGLPRRLAQSAGAGLALALAVSIALPAALAQSPPLTPAEIKAKEEAKKKAEEAKRKATGSAVQVPPKLPPGKIEKVEPKPAIVQPKLTPPPGSTPPSTSRTAAPPLLKPGEPPKQLKTFPANASTPPQGATAPVIKKLDAGATTPKTETKPAAITPAIPAGQASSTPYVKPPTTSLTPPPAVGAAGRAAAQTSPAKLDEIKQGRSERVVSGNRVVIQEPGNRTIIKQDNRVIIRNDDSQRFRRYAPNAVSNRRGDGTVETVYVRPDGMRIVSVVDAHGRVLRRTKRSPGGREIVLIDDRSHYRRNLAIGAAIGIGAAAIILSRPAVAIPRHEYIVEYDRASDDDIYRAFAAPPIERLSRPYSLDEIRYSETLRDRMRRVDLDSITFETGSWQIAPEQEGKLERMARAIDRVLRANPAEMFLIEGHTDAVGPEEDNLSLSDRRAESVADVLTERFGIPSENLVTQGYGEQFLKVDSQEAERANRRVATRRIGPLMGRESEVR